MESRPRLAIGDVVRLRPPPLKTHNSNSNSNGNSSNSSSSTTNAASMSVVESQDQGTAGNNAAGGISVSGSVASVNSGMDRVGGEGRWNGARHGFTVQGGPTFEVKVRQIDR